MDREKLWNAVERREDQSTRPDQAQVARDFKIALPYELNVDQRRALVYDFALEMAEKGMVVDIAIHRPDPDDDERNFHVHMLLTMREISPDGFGKKVREWNHDTELEQWKDRWSELGAQHLEHAGFGLEAERFRVGHFTLQKQREAVLQRGDYEWAESLDRTPQKHMGPHATAMENRGIETTLGDQNHDIEQRNQRRASTRQLSRTEGEIRLAYQLTDRAQAFADALEDRGLILARVAEHDLEKLTAIDKRRFDEKAAEHQRKMQYYDGRIAAEEQGGNQEKVADLQHRREYFETRYLGSLPWMMREGGAEELTPDQRAAAQRRYDHWQCRNRHSFEDYVSYVQEQWKERPANSSRFREHELVVVNQFGNVYPLTQRNTGEDPKLLRRYLGEIDTAPLFSVTGSWEVLKAVHDHRSDEALWPERERVWPTTPATLPATPRWTAPHLQHLYRAEPWWDFAKHYVTSDRRELDAPDHLNKPHSARYPEQPDVARIWEAYNRNKHSVNAFADALDEHGIVLCAASKLEADNSFHGASFARYSPAFREGEVLAMGPDARIYKINGRVAGADPKDIDRFLKKVDREQLPTIDEATKIMHERAEARQACAQLMSKLNPIEGRDFDPSLMAEMRQVTRFARRMASKGLDAAERPLVSAGRAFEFGARAIESLFAPVLTPEQKAAGQLADRERKWDAEEAERQRRMIYHER